MPETGDMLVSRLLESLMRRMIVANTARRTRASSLSEREHSTSPLGAFGPVRRTPPRRQKEYGSGRPVRF